ncbi:mandelate racemase/muconate lactonizing enzyme family protein [Nocardioides coralli]|uniref:mandelate racemase/muconate lactonizing enzyme family protein n=1 Tax=Nocardioides coralli TaxID=2872154 RepID=UPI001CA3B324|nr:mandelate racemase/muconate lactonizing enzyme family protein [Nocardioides coralli]QZY30457.1 mandelate racemase/muconate lactonizing enzyme family protein [Nocardioides coralli]
MRIERAVISVLSAPVDEPVEMSFSQLDTRDVVLVELEADGVTGVGESWVNYPAWAAAERIATLEHGVLPRLTGLDVSDPRRVQRELAEGLGRVARQWGAPGPVWQALSAVDVALWDLLARARGVPVANLLTTGEHRSRVQVYASGVGPSGVEELCEAATAGGFAAVKARVGFGRERDEETLARVRASTAPAVALFVDANQAWSVAEAADFCRWVEPYDAAWLEEPVAGNALEQLRELASRVDLPLACGENLYGLDDFLRYAHSGAVDVIQPDLAKSGGFTLATGLLDQLPPGVVASPHCYGGAIVTAASVQLAAAYPAQVPWLELDVQPNPLRDALVGNCFRARDGHVAVPSGPGLGVEIDRDVMETYLVDRRECELRAVV